MFIGGYPSGSTNPWRMELQFLALARADALSIGFLIDACAAGGSREPWDTDDEINDPAGFVNEKLLHHS